ncbi:hypothetical protein BC628DRAFT_1415204 [Trametes gibbosa]|nr:hypothetical protein BC628DRAFT_1415204 [Trametes gibbosa]
MNDMPIFAPIPAVDWQSATRPRVLPDSEETFCEELVQYEDELSIAIREIKNTIADLRTLRNSRASVNRLPPELLLHIFSLLIPTTTPPSSDNVMPITSVCRTWRTLALDAPELWSAVVVINYVGAEIFVERSKQTLLDVYLPRTLRRSYPMLDHTHGRIRSLVVKAGDPSTIIRLAKQLARERTPYLETLQLCADLPSSLVLDRIPALSYHGQDGAGTQPSPMPSLRSLCLWPICFPWTSTIYSNLSVLELEAFNMAPPSEERVLQILQQCPALTTFRLGVREDLAGPRMSPTDSAWDAHLPLLSTFRLKQVSTGCAGSLLSHLILPPSTTFVLTLDAAPEHSPPCPRLFPSSPDRIPGLAAANTLLFEGYSHDISFTLFSGPDLSNPVVSIILIPSDGGSTVMPGALVSTVEKFVANNAFCGWLAWHDVFCCAPLLRVLHIISAADEDLVRALDDLARPPSTVPPANAYPLEFPCPKLERLEFQYVPFTAALEDRIVQVVRARTARGLPLRSIFVRRSSFERRGEPCGGGGQGEAAAPSADTSATAFARRLGELGVVLDIYDWEGGPA